MSYGFLFTAFRCFVKFRKQTNLLEGFENWITGRNSDGRSRRLFGRYYLEKLRIGTLDGKLNPRLLLRQRAEVKSRQLAVNLVALGFLSSKILLYLVMVVTTLLYCLARVYLVVECFVDLFHSRQICILSRIGLHTSHILDSVVRGKALSLNCTFPFGIDGSLQPN
ncbi:hypothetical protein BDZ45DRAFT_450490 [Acephala macrosclerotiorum]|nr:hypothetical protein BDZ45DRAFT_450490 [Acephala macrosclerotiorum]